MKTYCTITSQRTKVIVKYALIFKHSPYLICGLPLPNRLNFNGLINQFRGRNYYMSKNKGLFFFFLNTDIFYIKAFDIINYTT